MKTRVSSFCAHYDIEPGIPEEGCHWCIHAGKMTKPVKPRFNVWSGCPICGLGWDTPDPHGTCDHEARWYREWLGQAASELRSEYDRQWEEA